MVAWPPPATFAAPGKNAATALTPGRAAKML